MQKPRNYGNEATPHLISTLVAKSKTLEPRKNC